MLRALKKGDWILLDEVGINVYASSTPLFAWCLVTSQTTLGLSFDKRFDKYRSWICPAPTAAGAEGMVVGGGPPTVAGVGNCSLLNPLPTKYAYMHHFKCARGRPMTHICVIETHLRAAEANTTWGRCKRLFSLHWEGGSGRERSWGKGGQKTGRATHRRSIPHLLSRL